ncbi:sarcosine oxidase subunit delta [Candidatus Persebacteraceae bacterium Df01]|jgi:sarcosine oxidase subunit delta|uniref:Sarcosine oxidase subunit delta n=1 Tax=Candidatus Doriopsillibacter californiensis TaxID=2970740 RepID=A0ABT7QLN1_9GAMM|nr:sarcosine oxidase subunit delta [Candidatus Persebacteraceae bacterium Df01]
MKLIPCPLNGPRPEDEFVCGGSIRAVPPSDADDATWRDYLFFDANLPNEVWEWWCHTPSVYWFAARRDTYSDVISATMTVGEAQKQLEAGTL